MTKCIFEKGINMPLCAVFNNTYIDYLTGQVIENENVLNFIKNGLTNKVMNEKEIELNIYKIIDLKKSFICYNYCINGCTNYLDECKQPLSYQERKFIIDKLINGEYKQVEIWK